MNPNAPDPYPLVLEGAAVERPWGGRRIAEFFQRDSRMPHCGESWEVSTRPEAPSVIRNGPLRDRSFDQAWQRLRHVLPPGLHAFPLLIKLLDARERLSVQVHPGRLTPADAPQPGRSGEAPKTEMWHVLDAAPGACIYAGLVSGTTPERFRQAIDRGTVAECLCRHPVHPGETYFIPGGTVHAIGAGCLIYEVQQNSDTTYRVFDWGRRDAQGRARELHVDDALRVIDWQAAPPHPIPAPEPTPSAGLPPPLVDCPFFTFRRLRITRPITVPREAIRSPAALFALENDLIINPHAGDPVCLPAGRSACLPGSQLAPLRLAPATDFCTFLLTTGPAVAQYAPLV